jgi:glycerophosphoryl diester phosphodiesterase
MNTEEAAKTKETEPSSTSHHRLRWIGIALLTIALLLVAYYALYFLLRGPVPSEQIVIAHRGGADLAPENTMTAFQNAIDVGADWMEFDIHRTSDGELVIMHDDTVDRTTDGSGMIKDMTAAEFAALEMADGKEPPTLEAVTDLAKAGGIGMLAEVKSPDLYPGMELEILQVIEDADYISKTVALSFGLTALANMKEANPELRVCPLYKYPMGVGNPQPANAEIVCPMGESAILYPWLIKKAHAQGRQVWVWPWKLDNPLGHRILLALGVDGIIVNDPVEAQALVNR